MKVLIITYYWPPAGGSGVQRWLKFAKYLPEFGIEPIIYTADANYEAIDESLLKEVPAGVKVLKQPIIEPNTFMKKKGVATARVNDKPSLIQRIMQYIRGNYFIPDARLFWIRPSVRYLSKYLKDNQVDVVISTGPPHSMHLIAMELKRRLGIKWVADFRDPMADLFYNSDLMLSQKALQTLSKLEKQIVENASLTTVVNGFIYNKFKNYSASIALITNGFDDEVLSDKNVDLDDKFTLSHIGLFPHQSNPIVLWEVLRELVKENEKFASDLEIKLIGNIAEEVILTINTNGLDGNLNRLEYMPHKQAITCLQKSQMLLLVVPNVDKGYGIIPGKVFEYIASNRPILGFGVKDGETAKIVEETNTGSFFEFDQDNVVLKEYILKKYNEYLTTGLNVVSTDVSKYHRKHLTSVLSQQLKSLSE